MQPTASQASPKSIDLRLEVSEHFAPYYLDRSRYLVLWGGAGSGKSYFAAQKVILRCLAEPGHRFIVVRKVASTLRHSVFRRLVTQVYDWHLGPFVQINKSDRTITFMNGSEILCIGLDDPEKLKSLDGPTSAWCEEPTELLPDDFEQLDLRFRGQSDKYYQFILSFNPVSTKSWLKERFFDTPQKSTRTVHSNYLHNPRLDESFLEMLGELRDRNPSLYKVYGEGDWGRLEGVIYEPPRILSREVWPTNFRDRCYGLDFGFNHKCALIDIGWAGDDPDPYLREVVAESGLTMPQLIETMHREIPSSIRGWVPIYCDSAYPGSIQELYDAGFNAIPATKGQGSVYDGIQRLKSLRFNSLDTNVELNSEFSTYCWAVDKNGKPVDAPVKHNDDCMDALRYGVTSHLDAPTLTIRSS